MGIIRMWQGVGKDGKKDDPGGGSVKGIVRMLRTADTGL